MLATVSMADFSCLGLARLDDHGDGVDDDDNDGDGVYIVDVEYDDDASHYVLMVHYRWMPGLSFWKMLLKLSFSPLMFLLPSWPFMVLLWFLFVREVVRSLLGCWSLRA